MSGIINIGIASRLSLMIAAAGMQFFLCHGLTAQTPNYFPHAVGDTWEYEEYDPSNGSTSFWRSKLVEATQRYDGKYELRYDNNLHPSYLYDSTGYLYHYSAGVLLMNFNATPGESWGYDFAPRILDSIYYSDALGLTKRIWEYSEWTVATDSTKSASVKYAEGFGLISVIPTAWWEKRRVLRGALISGINYGVTLEAENVSSRNLGTHSLGQNFPNPFSTYTHIPILCDGGEAEFALEVLDGLGRRVRSFVVQHSGVSKQTVLWDGLDELGRTVPDGLYHCVLFGQGSVEVLELIKLNR